MTRVRRQNFFNTVGACLKFTLFWLLVAIQLPILVFLPRGATSVKYMRFFMRILLYVVGIRVRVHGELSNHRPLLVISMEQFIRLDQWFILAILQRLLFILS